jgi:hypothetical protein
MTGKIRGTHPDFTPAFFIANHPYQEQKYLDQILTHLDQVAIPAPERD